jgi:hypothetical protein
VKVFGCRLHEGGAAHSGAGVRKPSQKATSLCDRATSAFPPATDIARDAPQVRFGPRADVRLVNAAPAFLVRNSSQTAPQDMKTCSGAAISAIPPIRQGDRMEHRNLLTLFAST